MAMGTATFWSGGTKPPAAVRLLKGRRPYDHGNPAGAGYGQSDLWKHPGMFIIVGGVPETDIHGS